MPVAGHRHGRGRPLDGYVQKDTQDNWTQSVISTLTERPCFSGTHGAVGTRA